MYCNIVLGCYYCFIVGVNGLLIACSAITTACCFLTSSPISSIPQSCRYGLLASTNHQIAAGANIELVDNTGYVPLTMASEFGHPACAAALIDAKCVMTVSDHLGRTSLHKAAEFNQASVTKLLIERGVDKETQDKKYYTPLLSACEHGALQSADVLISMGANLEAATGTGMTGLHIAAKKGHTAIIQLLLAKAATLESLDNSGCNAIYYACKKKVLFGLPRLSVCFNVLSPLTHPFSYRSSSYLAGYNRKINAIMELVRWGADAGITTCGLPPFETVSRKNKPFPNQILHRAPGLNDETCRGQETEIHTLAKHGKVRYILEHRMLQYEMESKDSYGEYPLHYAARFGQNDVIELLLSLGCSLECVDNWGFSPLHCACEGISVRGLIYYYVIY